MENLSQPKRADGMEWTPSHHRAAQLRGQIPSRPWRDIAAELDIREASAKNYTNIQGFAELTRWYRDQYIREIKEQEEDLITSGNLAALAALVSASTSGDVNAAFKLLTVTGWSKANNHRLSVQSSQTQFIVTIPGMNDGGNSDSTS